MDFKIAPQKIIFTYATCTSLTNKLKENSCASNTYIHTYTPAVEAAGLWCSAMAALKN